MTKKISSRAKGARGELELCEELRQFGFTARRSQQYSGVAGNQDIVHSVDGVHIECKRVEKLNVRAAYEQSMRDAKDGNIPVVAHRCNNSPWMISMSLHDFLAILKVDDDALS